MTTSPKEEKYVSLLSQTQSLVSARDHYLSNLSNLTALIQEQFSFHWVGFYLVDEDKNELYLGPFQGPIACTKIQYGKGVCGTAWKQRKAIIVDDVHQFDGHIACSSKTNSEIVLPFFVKGKLIGVLDIDSENFNDFDEVDLGYLNQVLNHLSHSMQSLT